MKGRLHLNTINFITKKKFSEVKLGLLAYKSHAKPVELQGLSKVSVFCLSNR